MKWRWMACTMVAVGEIVAGAGWSQPNPADAANQPAAEQAPGDQERREGADERLRSWEIQGEPVYVVGKAPLREEDLIGPYRQPRWTARRRFGETRVYVRPKGELELEYWLVPKLKRDGEESEIETQYELELGLPHRFQVDLYLVTGKEGSSGSLDVTEAKFEVRYALADWGRIWGNPTLYAEWIQVSDAPDHAEFKLLFGGQMSSRWHWGANLVYEHEMGGERTNSQEVTFGVGYTLRDEVVSLGLEAKLALEDVASDRGNYNQERLVGPSLQYRPLPPMHIDLAVLAGLGDESPRAKGLLILGWEF